MRQDENLNGWAFRALQTDSREQMQSLEVRTPRPTARHLDSVRCDMVVPKAVTGAVYVRSERIGSNPAARIRYSNILASTYGVTASRSQGRYGTGGPLKKSPGALGGASPKTTIWVNFVSAPPCHAGRILLGVLWVGEAQIQHKVRRAKRLSPAWIAFGH